MYRVYDDDWQDLENGKQDDRDRESFGGKTGSVLLYKTITLKLKLERKKKKDEGKNNKEQGQRVTHKTFLVVCWKTSDVELVLDSSFFFW